MIYTYVMLYVYIILLHAWLNCILNNISYLLCDITYILFPFIVITYINIKSFIIYILYIIIILVILLPQFPSYLYTVIYYYNNN